MIDLGAPTAYILFGRKCKTFLVWRRNDCAAGYSAISVASLQQYLVRVFRRPAIVLEKEAKIKPKMVHPRGKLQVSMFEGVRQPCMRCVAWLLRVVSVQIDRCL